MSILLAMILDSLVGEPPARFHPVVWFGHYLNIVGRRLPSLSPVAAFSLGASFWLLGAVVVFAGFFCIAQGLNRTPWWIQWPATALLLKPLFALRLLFSEVTDVESALRRDLASGRRQLSRIVSRDTSQLSAAEVRESALESLSENLSDSVIAPLFWFVVLGLPGAALYRFANTADAMWGYRGKWEWAGKWAAVADDLLNLIPARLTALGLLCSGSVRTRSFVHLAREAIKTPSPNSGWPMAALALAHDIRLGKPGVYTLNPGGRTPDPDTTTACLKQVRLTGWVLAIILSIGSVLLWRFIHGEIISTTWRY